MYTDCPSCQRQFRLRAYQLSAAGGLVQCGYCGERFNALERLHDKPLPRHRNPVPVINDEAAGEETPQFDIPGIEQQGRESVGQPAPADFDSEAETEPVDVGDAYAAATEESRPPPPAGPEPAQAEREVEADEAEETEKAGTREYVDSEATTELPPPLQAEEAPRRSRLSRFLWVLVLFLLLLAAAVQIAWFNRDTLLSRYPQFMPWARQVCEYFQCEVIRHRDVSAIKLLNRDVRDHPRYEDALLVNATIANESDVIQPFPVVQLVLFDTGGEVIGQRKFRPAEYLDDSIDIDGGMPPGQPVHIVLEVTGPTEGAVSFEFRFIEA